MVSVFSLLTCEFFDPLAAPREFLEALAFERGNEGCSAWTEE
jgi:hypothetical protein